MKRQLFVLLMVLTLATTGALFAQTPTTEPGVLPETETGTGVDVDVDTGERAEGAMDVDVNRTTDADTDASGIDEGGSLGDEDVAAGTATTTETAVSADTDMNSDLPATASELPTVALLGLLAMAAAFAVRFLRA
jgi:hypothetical protein